MPLTIPPLSRRSPTRPALRSRKRLSTSLITSLSNPRIVAARKLLRRAHRRETGQFLIEGPRALQDALDAGAPIAEVFVGPDTEGSIDLSRRPDIPTTEVGSRVIKALTDSVTPQGIVAIAAMNDTTVNVIADAALVLVLDAIADPGNAGTLIRSAAAAGAGGVVFTTGSVDPYSGKCVRAAAGALFSVPLVIDVTFDDVAGVARAAGSRLVGLDRSGAPYYDADLSGRVVLVAGSEAWGIAPDHRDQLDGTVAIPMPGGIESLNVASAASIVLFEAVRQRLSSATEEVAGD